MTGVSLTLEHPGLNPVLTMLNALASPRRQAEGLANVGGLIENQTKGRFSQRVSPDGEPWAPWSPAYAEGRKKGQTLLVATGAYRDSYAWDLTGEELRVGSNMVQAAILNFGGTDDMAPGPAAIPARQHLGLSPADIREIEDVMADWIESVSQ